MPSVQSPVSRRLLQKILMLGLHCIRNCVMIFQPNYREVTAYVGEGLLLTLGCFWERRRETEAIRSGSSAPRGPQLHEDSKQPHSLDAHLGERPENASGFLGSGWLGYLSGRRRRGRNVSGSVSWERLHSELTAGRCGKSSPELVDFRRPSEKLAPSTFHSLIA